MVASRSGFRMGATLLGKARRNCRNAARKPGLKHKEALQESGAHGGAPPAARWGPQWGGRRSCGCGTRPWGQDGTDRIGMTPMVCQQH